MHKSFIRGFEKTSKRMSRSEREKAEDKMHEYNMRSTTMKKTVPQGAKAPVEKRSFVEGFIKGAKRRSNPDRKDLRIPGNPKAPELGDKNRENEDPIRVPSNKGPKPAELGLHGYK